MAYVQNCVAANRCDDKVWEGVQDGEHVYTRGGCMLMYGKTKQKNSLIQRTCSWGDRPLVDFYVELGCLLWSPPLNTGCPVVLGVYDC